MGQISTRYCITLHTRREDMNMVEGSTSQMIFSNELA